MTDTSKYIVTGNGGAFRHDGQTMLEGDEIELTKEQATQHLASGAVAPMGSDLAKPAQKAAADRKAKADAEFKAAHEKQSAKLEKQPKAGDTQPETDDTGARMVREAQAPGPRTDKMAAEDNPKVMRSEAKASAVQETGRSRSKR
jgi:hypothetical protein